MMLENFVVFEGIDGSGTTSQIRRLQDKVVSLEQIDKFWFTAEPTTGETGLFLRRCLSGEVRLHPKTLARLFAADRCEHLYGKAGIVETLNTGKIVITDRYIFSSLAYQTADCQGFESQKANEDFPLPQYLFYFDIDVKAAFERVAKRGSEKEIYEKIEFQEKVRSEYEKIINHYKSDAPSMKIIRLNATESVEKIHEKIWSVLGKLPTM